MVKQKLLWLDDIRDPTTEKWNNEIAKYIINPLTVDIIWVKNYNEFVKYLNKYNLPNIISFDHDLADEHYDYFEEEVGKYEEKTGMDCCKFLVNYCLDNNLELPQFNIHSANPVGAENMRKYLVNFLKKS